MILSDAFGRRFLSSLLGGSLAIALCGQPANGATLQWQSDHRPPPPLVAEISDFVTQVHQSATGAGPASSKRLMDIVLQHIVGTLRSRGYLDATATMSGAGLSDDIRVDPGPLYTIGLITITGLDPEVHRLLPEDALVSRFRTLLGNPLDEAALQRAESGLVADLQFASYGRAKARGSLFSKNSQAHVATWQVRVEAGAPLVFGNLLIEGTSRSDVGAVLKDAPFETGTPFRSTVIGALRDYLENDWHFRDVEVFLSGNPDPDGRINVMARVDEQPFSWHELNSGWETAEAISLFAIGAFGVYPTLRYFGRRRRWAMAGAGFLFLALLAASYATLQRLLFLLYP